MAAFDYVEREGQNKRGQKFRSLTVDRLLSGM